jgi:hypothetical protein
MVSFIDNTTENQSFPQKWGKMHETKMKDNPSYVTPLNSMHFAGKMKH